MREVSGQDHVIPKGGKLFTILVNYYNPVPVTYLSSLKCRNNLVNLGFRPTDFFRNKKKIVV